MGVWRQIVRRAGARLRVFPRGARGGGPLPERSPEVSCLVGCFFSPPGPLGGLHRATGAGGAARKRGGLVGRARRRPSFERKPEPPLKAAFWVRYSSRAVPPRARQYPARGPARSSVTSSPTAARLFRSRADSAAPKRAKARALTARSFRDPAPRRATAGGCPSHQGEPHEPAPPGLPPNRAKPLRRFPA